MSNEPYADGPLTIGDGVEFYHRLSDEEIAASQARGEHLITECTIRYAAPIEVDPNAIWASEPAPFVPESAGIDRLTVPTMDDGVVSARSGTNTVIVNPDGSVELRADPIAEAPAEPDILAAIRDIARSS